MYDRNTRRVFMLGTTYDPVCIKVHRAPSWAEYRVRLYLKGSAQPPSDYFTDSLEDARDTARAMFRHATANLKG